MIVFIRGETPPATTVPLAFALGEAQVDFGVGPKLALYSVLFALVGRTLWLRATDAEVLASRTRVGVSN